MKNSRSRTKLTSLLAATCLALAPIAFAVDPPPDGGYPGQNTAEGENALFSLTTGADNTAMGFDALDSNTTGSDNAPAGRNWTRTGSLNTARYYHTATLLQNGNVVLVAGGLGPGNHVLPSAELGHGHR